MITDIQYTATVSPVATNLWLGPYNTVKPVLVNSSYLLAAARLHGVPSVFTSMHPPESSDSDSDANPTPMASLQPGSLDETVVPEEEQGRGPWGLGLSPGRASPETDSSYETGAPTSATSSQYHSLQNINFGELYSKYYNIVLKYTVNHEVLLHASELCLLPHCLLL